MFMLDTEFRNHPPQRASQLSILLVDDELAIRLSVGEALRAAGHRVEVASDGADALLALATEEFDLLISDIHMPRASGLELFRHICEHVPHTDVILMTGHGAVEDSVSALKQGAKDYLLKPFDVEELVIRVARVAELRVLKQQLSALSASQGRPEPKGSEAPVRVNHDTIGPLSAAMKAFERTYLLRTLDTTQGKKTAAAKQLGISRKNLWEKLRAHGINQPGIEE